MLLIKMPPEMKKALKSLAENEFSSVSGILKKAAENYLLEHEMDWRKDPVKDKPKKKPS